MRMNKYVKISFSLLLAVFFFACSNEKDFPETPVLEVRDFTKVSSTKAFWTLGFTDGDGDIGVRNENDSDNFFVTILSIEGGVSREIKGQSFRIPVVENIRTEKGIEGSFEFEIDVDLLLPLDSVQFNGFVVDRAMNESNVVSTPIFTTN